MAKATGFRMSVANEPKIQSIIKMFGLDNKNAAINWCISNFALATDLIDYAKRRIPMQDYLEMRGKYRLLHQDKDV